MYGLSEESLTIVGIILIIVGVAMYATVEEAEAWVDKQKAARTRR